MTAIDPLWLALLFVAPFIGSFLGVVIRRLPEGRPTLWGHSECDCCYHSLAWSDLLPMFSWFLLHSRCRYCGSELGVFFPAIELAALLPVAAAAGLPTTAALVKSTLLGWIVLPILVLDCSGRPVPLVLGLTLLLLGLVTCTAPIPAAVSMTIALPLAGLVACFRESDRFRSSTSAARAVQPLGLAAWLNGPQTIAVIVIAALFIFPAAVWRNHLPAAIKTVSWRSSAAICAWVVYRYGSPFSF